MFIYRNDTDHHVWVDGRLVLPGDSLIVDALEPSPLPENPVMEGSPPVSEPEPEKKRK